MKKMWLVLSLVMVVFGFVGCDKAPVETNGKGGVVVQGEDEEIWVWTSNDMNRTIMLYIYQANGRLHITSTSYGLFEEVWLYYKIESDIMALSTDGKFTPEITQQSYFLVHQYTEDVLELESAGMQPAVSIPWPKSFLFKRVR